MYFVYSLRSNSKPVSTALVIAVFVALAYIYKFDVIFHAKTVLVVVRLAG